MKKFIKFAAIMIAVLVFAFSSNPQISGIRNSLLKNSKELFQNGIDAMTNSGSKLPTHAKRWDGL